MLIGVATGLVLMPCCTTKSVLITPSLVTPLSTSDSFAGIVLRSSSVVISPWRYSSLVPLPLTSIGGAGVSSSSLISSTGKHAYRFKAGLLNVVQRGPLATPGEDPFKKTFGLKGCSTPSAPLALPTPSSAQRSPSWSS